MFEAVPQMHGRFGERVLSRASLRRLLPLRVIDTFREITVIGAGKRLVKSPHKRGSLGRMLLRVSGDTEDELARTDRRVDGAE